MCVKGRKEMFFYITTHSTHFINGYMASDIWQRTTQIGREETCCRHIGYSFRLAARVLLYAPSHRQCSTYRGLCYTSRGALAGTSHSSMGGCVLNAREASFVLFFSFCCLRELCDPRSYYVVTRKSCRNITANV